MSAPISISRLTMGILPQKEARCSGAWKYLEININININLNISINDEMFKTSQWTTTSSLLVQINGILLIV
jgi:hypothetical protein